MLNVGSNTWRCEQLLLKLFSNDSQNNYLRSLTVFSVDLLNEVIYTFLSQKPIAGEETNQSGVWFHWYLCRCISWGLKSLICLKSLFPRFRVPVKLFSTISTIVGSGIDINIWSRHIVFQFLAVLDSVQRALLFLFAAALAFLRASVCSAVGGDRGWWS